MEATTLVIGLGNPVLSDDGVGWHVSERVRHTLAVDPDVAAAIGPVKTIETCTGGLHLAELMVGYTRVIVVDAILTGQSVPGTIRQLSLADLPGTLNSSSAHNTNLYTALHTLRACGALVPDDDAVTLVAIEAQNVWTFGEDCTPPIERAIPAAVATVCSLLKQVTDCKA